jgi:hypothetical protein
MAELIKFDEAEPVARGDGIESVRLTPNPLEELSAGSQYPPPQPQHDRAGHGHRGRRDRRVER